MRPLLRPFGINHLLALHVPRKPFATATAGNPLRMADNGTQDITIVGGGIIGCCSAYYLTRHPSYDPARHRITLLEASSTNSAGREVPGGAVPAAADPAALLADPSLNPRNPAHDGIAGGASGKAGGLLAKWGFPSNIVPLSFRLHAELAAEHGGEARWGYRRCYASQVDCVARLPGAEDKQSKKKKTNADTAQAGGGEEESLTTGLHKEYKKEKQTAAQRRLGIPADLDWLLEDDGSVHSYGEIGNPDDTAQVHPELFTRAMAALAEEKGVKIVTGAKVTGIDVDSESKKVRAVTYVVAAEGQEETTLPTSKCVVAAGPWTAALLPSVPVTASRAHSVVLRTPRVISPYSLFTSIRLPAGFRAPTTGSTPKVLKSSKSVEPEIYARPDGTAWACGGTDSAVPLPPGGNSEVEVDLGRCDDIAAQVGAISDELAGEVLARQACYLPQGGPYIGFVDEAEMGGVLVAAGHTCWGILNGPGTGKLISELVLEGKASSARLGGCDPLLL